MMFRRRYGRVFALLAAGAALGSPAVTGLTATPALAAVDLQVAIDGSTEVVAGELIQLRIGADIPGPPAPAGVKMTVALPAGVTYEGNGGGSGPCEGQAGGRVVVCIPDPGEPAQGHRAWEFTARAAGSLAIGAELTTTVVASAGDSAETDTASLVTRVVEHGATFLTVTGPSEPVGPGQSFRVTVRVHYAEGPPIEGFHLFAAVETWWYAGGGIVNVPARCSGDPGSLLCETDQRLEAGDDLDLVYEFRAGSDPERTFSQRFWTFAFGDMVEASTLITFAAPSAGPTPSSAGPATPSASPSHSSASPSPTGAGAGGDDPAGGGLPITGAAPGPLAAAGALLIATGAAVVVLTRRRRSTAP